MLILYDVKIIDKYSIKNLGELYQPDSLSSFLHCWQRILSSRGSKIDLKHYKEFVKARKVLAARRKKLTKNKQCAARPLSNFDVDKLFIWLFWYHLSLDSSTQHLVEVDDNIWISSSWRVTKTSVWRRKTVLRLRNHPKCSWMGQGERYTNSYWGKLQFTSEKLQPTGVRGPMV